MKALSTLKSAIDQSSFVGIIALILLTPVLQPQLVSAAALQAQEQPTAQVFEIKIADASLLAPTPKPNITKTSLSIDSVKQSDPITISLQTYLESHNSPLKDYTSKLLEHRNWKTILAISFVESNMCVHNLRYNCSGIGGPGHFRQYANIGEWVDDMGTLLDDHYNGWTLDKMNGVYVQPRSANWGYGSKKMLVELTKLEQQAENQKRESAQINTNTTLELAALPTFRETTN